MRVLMGNPAPYNTDHGHPCIYEWDIPDGVGYDHPTGDRPNGKEALTHVQSSSSFSHLPGFEAFVSITRDWPSHSSSPPTWVWSDNDDLAQMLAEAYDIPVGIPADVEDTHYTQYGPPGVGPNQEG